MVMVVRDVVFNALLHMGLCGSSSDEPVAGKISHPSKTNVCDHVSALKLGVSLEMDASKDGNGPPQL